eukprot:2315663-Rhodomonas_salina.1
MAQVSRVQGAWAGGKTAAVRLVLEPLARELVSIDVHDRPRPFAHPVPELPGVDAVAMRVVHAAPVHQVLLPLAVVRIQVGKRVDPAPVPLVPAPFALVPAALSRERRCKRMGGAIAFVQRPNTRLCRRETHVLPSAYTASPSPSLCPIFHWPLYFSPFGYVSVPSPCRLSFTQSP